MDDDVTGTVCSQYTLHSNTCCIPRAASCYRRNGWFAIADSTPTQNLCCYVWARVMVEGSDVISVGVVSDTKSGSLPDTLDDTITRARFLLEARARKVSKCFNRHRQA
jgi:hypothetical protein